MKKINLYLILLLTTQETVKLRDSSLFTPRNRRSSKGNPQKRTFPIPTPRQPAAAVQLHRVSRFHRNHDVTIGQGGRPDEPGRDADGRRHARRDARNCNFTIYFI